MKQPHAKLTKHRRAVELEVGPARAPPATDENLGQRPHAASGRADQMDATPTRRIEIGRQAADGDWGGEGSENGHAG